MVSWAPRKLSCYHSSNALGFMVICSEHTALIFQEGHAFMRHSGRRRGLSEYEQALMQSFVNVKYSFRKWLVAGPPFL